MEIEREQCDKIWRNFCHFSKSLQVFGKFLTVYFLFGKMLSTLWQICDIIGLILIAAKGHILKNNLTIWSHTECECVNQREGECGGKQNGKKERERKREIMT